MQRRFPVLLVITLALLLASCDSSGSDESADACMTATVNGERFSRSECEASYFQYTLPDAHLILSGGTSTDGGESITLEIRGAQRGDTGTYTVAGARLGVPVRALYFRDRGFGAENYFVATAGQGAITLNAFTEVEVAGTFEFNAPPGDGASVTVTDGEFRIPTPE